MTHRRYSWTNAFQDIAMAIAERTPDQEEFTRLWSGLGGVVWYLVQNDPRTAAGPFDEADAMCPNCQTPWKCNGPHLADQTPYALRADR